MQSHWLNTRSLALTLILGLSTIVYAQPAITGVTFEQLDWYGYEGKDEVLVDEDSVWGALSFNHESVGETWYLNVGIAPSESDPPVWAVQNLPLFADSICTGECGLAIDIDLSELGMVPGDDWAVAHYAVEIDTQPADSGPSAVTDSAAVVARARHTTQWPIVGDGNHPKKVNKPAGHKPGAGAKVTDISPPRGMEGVDEEDNHCFAGATARSIAWLDKEYKLGIKKTAQEIYEELKKRGVSKPNDGGEGVEEDWIDKKAKYLDESGGVTKVWDSEQHLKRKLNIAIKTDKDVPFTEWFLDELQTGEDIELAFTNGSSSHIVTVERVYREGNKTYVEYRDDDAQGTKGKGDDKPKRAEIFIGGDGRPRFGSSSNVIHFALSESPKRTPSADGSVVTWKAPNGTPTNSGREPVTVKGKKGGKVTYFWTNNGKPHPGYGTFTSGVFDKDGSLTFTPPRDRTVTDWKGTVTSAKGSNSNIGANIKRKSPWGYYALQSLPPIPTRIPAPLPTEDAFELTIYMAVNLELYMTANPQGPVNGMWQVGQTLDEAGITIVDGRVPGIEGIFFSTTDFIFDPESETGWVPSTGDDGWLDSESYQTEHGPILIAAEIGNPFGPPRDPGDMNCDGAVDFNDIDPFVAALISRDDYETENPGCNWFNGDINADESVDFNDIDGFIECLINGGC